MQPAIRIKLSAMMFIQYFIWGAWSVTLGTYLQTLHFSDTQIGLAYGTTAVAAMISPFFVGLIADRFFAAEKTLAVLHLAGAVLLYFASTLTTFETLYPCLIAYTLLYMPTMPLTNAIVFHQSQNPGRDFPGIRVLGTIGWIAAGLTVGFMKVEQTSLPMVFAAACSLLTGIYALVALPATPPGKRGLDVTPGQVLGLDALQLMRSRSFAVLMICSLLLCVPLSFYYNFTNVFLNELGVANAAATMTLGQASEIVFMLLMPLMFARLGYKKMLAIGMGAWVIRYAAFAFGDATAGLPLLYAGILLHGICYDFLFVTTQIYVDNKAPVSMRNAAQGLLAFATHGLGFFIGSFVTGGGVQHFATGPTSHQWYYIWLIPAAIAGVLCVVFIALFREKEGVNASPDVAGN